MSRHKIKKHRKFNKTQPVASAPETKKDNKAKRAAKATAGFLAKVGKTIGSTVKQGATIGVEKGVVPASKATSRFFVARTHQVKEAFSGLIEARRTIKDLKALDREAGALAMLLESTSSRGEAIDTLESLKSKMSENIRVIDAAVAALRKEVSNDANQAA